MLNRQFTITVDKDRDGDYELIDQNVPDGTINYGKFLDIYQRFSPRTMACQLMRRKKLGLTMLEPYCETVFAAVLFADISGFTRLSARLSEDELKFHINQYFSQLLGVVQENHGDVIKFCGDAVMILWSVDKDADDGVKSAAVLMASVCALQLLVDCGKYDRGEGSQAVSLRLHCGIGCGLVHCMCVGENRRWEFLISGEPIRQVETAQTEASVGEVCLSPEAYAYVTKLDSIVMPLGSYKLIGRLKKQKMTSMALLYEDAESTSASRSLVSGADNSFEQGGIFSVDENSLFDHPPSNRESARAEGIGMLASHGSGDSLDSNEKKSALYKRSINALYVPVAASVLGRTSKNVSAPPVMSRIDSPDKSSPVAKSTASSPSREFPPKEDFSPQLSLDKGNDRSPSCSCVPSRSKKSNDVFLDKVNSENPRSELTATSVAASPVKSETRSISPKKSFIVDLGQRMARNTTDSFMFATRRNSNSQFDGDVAFQASTRSLEILKASLNMDRDPNVIKARMYLYEICGLTFNPKLSTLSTVSSGISEYENGLYDLAKCLRCFIHEAALQAIESDLFDFGYLAEKRVVSTMFIEILGLDEDFSNGLVKRPQRVMSFVLACLNRFEGSLRQFVYDDKGCVIIAAFGLPGSHHEDNCTRAVETAKAIQKSLEILNLSCGTGIAMGSVYCGLVGSGARCEYAMMGSSVNLAARLMSKCGPGAILVNDTIYKGANEDFEFQTLEPIVAKGYESRVDVYSPGNRIQSRTIGLGSRPNQHCKFVGRSEEKLMFSQDIMKFGYESELKERTVGHIIEGPPGIGKTSLVAEINELAQSNANISAIVIASASASHMSSSYFVIRQILDVVLSLDCFSSSATVAKLASRSKSSARAISQAGETLNGEIEAQSWDKKSFSENDASSTSGNPAGSPPKPRSTHSATNSLSRNGNDDVKMSLSSARSVLRLSSAFIEKNFLTFSAEDNLTSRNTLEALETWLESSGQDIMVSELDPIGVFHQNTGVVDRMSSYDVIYATGGTNMFSTGGTQQPVGRSRSGISHCSDDIERVSYPMSQLLPLLGEILSIKCNENSVTSSLTPAMRWRMGDALLVMVLQLAIKREKIVFIVENLQWCDYQSLSVLLYLVRDTQGGFFIGTERPFEASHSMKGNRRNRYGRIMTLIRSMCHITPLRPLFPNEVQRIMEQIAGPDLDSYPALKTEEVISQVIKRTAGLPFSVIALCLALKSAIRERKFININHLPSGAHNIIVNRFDQLSNTEKVVLKIASVIGREFDFNLLKMALTELNYSNCTVNLIQILDQLVDAKLIKAVAANCSFTSERSCDNDERVDGELFTLKYEFIDQSIQYGIYNLMLTDQRELAHTVTGALLEKKQKQFPKDKSIFAEIVHHYNLSNDPKKRIGHLRLAADQAEDLKDYNLMIYYYAELVKFATKESIETHVEKCCSKGERKSSEKGHSNEAALLNRSIVSESSITRHAGDLRIVRNIFAHGNKNVFPNGGLVAVDGWFPLRRVAKNVSVVDDVVRLGVTNNDVCMWIAVVADAHTRVGSYHWGHNLSIIALSNLNCLLSLDTSCCGVFNQMLKIARCPKFAFKEVLEMALLCYENLAVLMLMRGFPEDALNVLQMAKKNVNHNDPMWLPYFANTICRFNAYLSLTYLGIGDRSRAAALISTAIVEKNSHFEPYTNACCTYINSFHLSASGSFSAARQSCLEAMEIFTDIDQGGSAHLAALSAGWYAFLIGDLLEAKALYRQVFDYGLSTAHRPLIKMSLELYGVILILCNDFNNANAILDHLRSPLQSGDVNDSSTKPSPIKSCLIAFSYVLDKRFVEAIPHIQFSCRVMSVITPSNIICGLYLFFAAYSALEVLNNVSRLTFEERVTANIILKEAVTLTMNGLQRCSEALPCLRMLYLTCTMKQLRLKPDVDEQEIQTMDSQIYFKFAHATGLSPALTSINTDDADDAPGQLPHQKYRHRSPGMFRTAGKHVNLSPTNNWVGVGNVGMYDDFALGKLFLHKERDALYKHAGVTENCENGQDSKSLYLQLSRLYLPDTSVRNMALSTLNEAPVERQQLSHTPKSNGIDDGFCLSDQEIENSAGSLKSLDVAHQNTETAQYVADQLDKLRVYELTQGIDKGSVLPDSPRNGSLRRYDSVRDGKNGVTLKPKTQMKLYPLSYSTHAKISPESHEIAASSVKFPLLQTHGKPSSPPTNINHTNRRTSV